MQQKNVNVVNNNVGQVKPDVKKSMSSPSVSVGDLPLFFRSLTIPTETKIGRPRTETLRGGKSFYMNGNHGFTLIELLVVVLINCWLYPDYSACRINLGKATAWYVSSYEYTNAQCWAQPKDNARANALCRAMTKKSTGKVNGDAMYYGF